MQPWQRRISLLGMLALALATTLPTQAGTLEAPEIQDPARDQALFGEAPGCAQGQCTVGTRIDFLTVYIADETATDFKVYMVLSAAPVGALTATSHWNFHATFGGTEVVSSASGQGGENANPPAEPGDNTAATATDGNTLILTILKSVYGAPAAGAKLTNVFVDGVSESPTPVPVTLATDRAPDTGGVEYTFGGAGGNTTTPGDSDGDQLNDTCETEFFGGLNTTNDATQDPDGDGLTNGQECASNPRTDPTKADTDGDGTSDKEDSAPTDPTKGGTSGSQTSTSTSRSSTSGTRSGSSTTGSGTGSADDDADGEVNNLDDAVEKLKSDVGYLGTSAGGMVAVLLLAILALAVRWSL